MSIHEIADRLRKIYPGAVGIHLFVNETEHEVELKYYTGRGEHSMKRVDGEWCSIPATPQAATGREG